MNKKIIFSLFILLPALSHGMERNEKLGKKLIQTSFNRYNLKDLDKKKNFSQALKLLDKGANPDFRESPEDPTSLMIAVYHNDQDYAHLLLTYDANPHQKALYPERTHEGCINAFEMESTGWLKKMIDELNPQPQKKRNYNY